MFLITALKIGVLSFLCEQNISIIVIIDFAICIQFLLYNVFIMITIVFMIILHYHDVRTSLILSANNGRISEIPKEAVTDNVDNTDSDKLDTSIFQSYPIIVPQNWILQICLKDSLLLDKLHSNKNVCDDYSCMFSKLIQDESMKSVISIIRNDTIDNTDQGFNQSIQDCIVWWKLFKGFDKNANPRRELGKCLFQTFSTKCRENVLNAIKLLLLSTKKEKE
nr:PREDICTED: uncharacterized protein LOC100879866 isoform X2 [Megachile rotundata]